MFGAYVLFPYSNEDEYRNHRFFESIDKVNIGGLPFLPSSTAMVSEMLDQLISDSPASAFERATLPIGIEAKLAKVDWSVRDVLIGTLSKKEQLDICLKHKFYHIPAAKLKERDFPIRYIAMYQSKTLFGAEAGIQYYGEITKCIPVRRSDIKEIPSKKEDLYYRFEIKEWKQLTKPVAAKEMRFVKYLTNLFLLEHSAEMPELWIRSEEEYRLYSELKRAVNDTTINEEDNNLDFAFGEFLLSFDDGKISVSKGNEVSLTPLVEDVTHDVSLFLRYMDGYEKFHGDVSGMQRRYFEFANWFFCSPFMGCMRDMAVRYNQNLLPYPVFGLVYGQSKAGKTSFLETLLKMMIGQKTKLSAPDFTRSSIESLKRTVKGAPIIVDDLTNARFNQHAIETIKNDDFGVADHLVHYPAVVISANEDVKAVAPEVIRRTVICRVQAGLTNTEVMRSSIVRTVQREIGTAFYREYLRRMLDVVPELLEIMKSDEAESAPDILSISSQIIVEIMREYSEQELPTYIRELTLDDYFSERVTGSYAIKTIRNAWKTSQASFEISTRANELRYNAGAPWEADRILKELPETLEAHKSRDWLVMNLDAARDFFDIPFRKSLFGRLKTRGY